MGIQMTMKQVTELREVREAERDRLKKVKYNCARIIPKIVKIAIGHQNINEFLHQKKKKNIIIMALVV